MSRPSASRLLAEQLRNKLQLPEAEGQPLDAIFEEEPVDLTTFVQDKKFMNSPPWSDIQFDAVRHMEQIFLPTTYPAMVEAFGPQWTPVRFVNLCYIEWGKGSSAPYVPIYNAADGQWQRLDSFTGGPVASAYHHKGHIGTHYGIASFKEGEGEMFRVKTTRGREIDVWEGHRFLTKSSMGWERLWDLEEGDKIAVATTVPEPQNIVHLPDEHVELLAFLIANGSTSSGNRGTVTFGQEAPRSIQRTVELLEAFPFTRAEVHYDEWQGTMRVHIVPKDTRGVRPGKGSPEYSVFLWDFIEKYGLAGKTAHTKIIPPEIFSLSNEQLRLFISRLTDSDGWVSRSNTSEIGYGTMSKELAEQICQLWLRLGVLPEKKVKRGTYQNGPCTSWQLRIREAWAVRRLGEQLALLDKAESLQSVLDQTPDFPARGMHGDLFWDKIVSIEPLGWGEYWTLTVDGPASYVSSGGVLNHNSGKDSICRIANARVAYLLLCLHSPQKYFGMPPQDEIQTLNVAASATQAHRAFFRPLATMCRTSPWFKDKLLAEPSDMSTSIRLIKQIEMVSGHSQTDTMEGLNLIFAIADEISAFRTKEELERFAALAKREPTKSAEAILKLLRTSAATRFPKNYKTVAISYPRFKGDAIQQLIQRGQEDNTEQGEKSRTYVSGPYATWDVNPRIESKDDFTEDYRSDPDTAEAMYECRPKLSANRYFKNEVAVFAALDENRSCPLKITYEWALDPELGTQPGWQPVFHFDPEFHPIQGAVYALHGDMAVSGDRAGIAMSHVRAWQWTEPDMDTPVDQPLERRPIVRNDFTTSFSADASAQLPNGTPLAREVQIRWYRRLIQELVRRKFVVGSVTFDQFQSTDTIQILNSWGIESKRVSMDMNAAPWASLRDVMYDHRLEGHYSARLRDEILGLTRLPNGKVDHPLSGSKDEADALAGSVLGALELGGDEGEDPQLADAPGLEDMDLTVTADAHDKDLSWLATDALSIPEALTGAIPW